MVERKLPKLETGVRFPSSALAWQHYGLGRLGYSDPAAEHCWQHRPRLLRGVVGAILFACLNRVRRQISIATYRLPGGPGWGSWMGSRRTTAAARWCHP